MATAELEVTCFGRRAGLLRDDATALSFAYDATWVGDGQPPLSQSLPLDGAFAPGAVGAFFDGLLPEGRPRERLARALHVSRDNDFGLLERVGGDVAGAISLVDPSASAEAPPAATGVQWLDEAALGRLIVELPDRPMHVDEDGEYRLSLAGAQDKLPVIFDGERVGVTKGGTPSTHILKTPIAGLPATVLNEAFCLRLGRELGVPTANAQPLRAAGEECLLVERYDRRSGAGGTQRLHQEDFCQALGIPAQRKYENEGGPSLTDCVALVRRVTVPPAGNVLTFLDYVALSFLVGNHDAHGKNSSLLYEPGSRAPSLAPAYDVLATFVYRDVRSSMSRKMAMRIGGEYRPDRVAPRHLERFASGAALGLAPTRRRLRLLADRAPQAADVVAGRYRAEGWDDPILMRLVEEVQRRAGWLHAVAA